MIEISVSDDVLQTIKLSLLLRQKELCSSASLPHGEWAVEQLAAVHEALRALGNMEFMIQHPKAPA